MFFRPLFHSTVLNAKSYMLCSKMRFWTPICAPRCIQNATTGPPFTPKGPQRWSPPNGWRPPKADLGATSGPKRPRLRFHRFRGRFWSDFGLDFKQIWAWFRSNLRYHLWIRIGIPKALLAEVFPRSFCMFHADSWYSIQAYWYSIKGELSRQASRYSRKTFLVLNSFNLSDFSNLSNVSNLSNLSNLSWLIQLVQRFQQIQRIQLIQLI